MERNRQDFGIIYFSGTGNTKLLAEHMAGLLGAEIHSIEEKLDWHDFLGSLRRVILFYPVHYSVPPMIMRDFLAQHARNFEYKEIISIVSQMIFSGDGARAVKDFLPESARVIDTHHVNMPNNIPNIPFVPVSTVGGNRRKTDRALRKIERMAAKIKAGQFKRRHVSKFSLKLGEIQRVGGLESEISKKDKVWVAPSCIGCGLCERICPTQNFLMHGKKAVPQGSCSLCMRCENRCPTKSIRVLLNKPVKRVYPGPKPSKPAAGKDIS